MQPRASHPLGKFWLSVCSLMSHAWHLVQASLSIQWSLCLHGNLTWQDANSSQSHKMEFTVPLLNQPKNLSIRSKRTNLRILTAKKRGVWYTWPCDSGAHDITSRKYKASELPSEEGQCYRELSEVCNHKNQKREFKLTHTFMVARILQK